MRDWKLLLVDDEVDFVQTLAERLEIRDIACRVAHAGEEALRLVDEDAPDVVILDLMMPGMKGVEVQRRLLAGHPWLKIILLTGQAEVKDGLAGLKDGAFDYMVKPLSIEVLIEKLDEAVKASRAAKATACVCAGGK